MLRSLGGSTVRLRIAVGLTSEDRRGLGLTPQNLEDVEVGPALLHRDDRGNLEVLMSATSLRSLAMMCDESTEECLRAVIGVVDGEQLRSVSTANAEYFAGMEFLYRFKVVE